MSNKHIRCISRTPVVVLTYSAGHRVAPEGGEVSTESVGHLPAADDGAHGEPVAEPLADGDDVGHEAVVHEGPHVVPHPPQPGLNLVCDHQPAVLPDNSEDREYRDTLGKRVQWRKYLRPT